MPFLSPLQTTVFQAGVQVASAPADRTSFNPSQILNEGMNPGFRLQQWQKLIYEAGAIPVLNTGDTVAVAGDATYNVAFCNVFMFTTQLIVWRWLYNVTVDIVLQNSGNDTDTIKIPGMNAVLQPAESIARGAEAQSVETDPTDAMMYCSPSAEILRGRYVVVKTVNGAAASGPQVRRYRILSVDDQDFMGDTYVCKLSEQA